MGRVYNALVRAEKWKDGARPIGRPDRNVAARGALVRSFNAASTATAQPAFENTPPQTDDAASPFAGRSFGAAQTDGSSQSALAPRPLVLAPRPASEASAPNGSVTAFEEPIEVSNIRDFAVDLRLAVLTREDPLAVERYRALAVKLLNLADRRKLKTLLITSAEAGEGKSTVAACAAWSLAKHPERRVLLIDANLASPSVGRTFGLDPKRGWRNLLDRSCEFKHAAVRLDPNGLYVMTPGTASASQSTDTLSSRFEDVIAELTPRFDLVVVDSPAILESPEAQRLAEILDGAVIVARACHTHHSKVIAARKLVPKERRLGVVLNESEADADIPYARRGKSSLAGRLFGRKR